MISDDVITQNQGMEYKKRFLEKFLVSASKAFKVLIVLGARQVGKSTLLRHLYPDRKVFFFDAILDPYQVKNQPDLFLDINPPPLILDEVQFVPELLSAVKRRVDLTEQKGLYFLTGSQNLNVLKSIAETMTGRAAILHLEGMSLLERQGFGDKESWLTSYLNDPEAFIRSKPLIVPSLPPIHEVIWRGSLPQALILERSEIPLFHNSYIQTYVERDVRSFEKIEDLGQFGRFLPLLAALSGQEINFTQLGREIGVTSQTAKRWIFALSACYQWREILPFHQNPIKKVSEKRKGLLTDTGIACHLLRISSPEDLAIHPNLGALFETWVINHLFQLFCSLPMMPAVYHWRVHSGAEIDLVLEMNGTYYPLEIKFSSRLMSNDYRHFKTFKELHKDKKVAPGLVIHAGDENYKLDESTMALSWKAF